MRAQTTLDFATGVSVFLLAVLFVFTFVPGILTPFTQTAQEETVTANRVADLVSKDILADTGSPYLLDGPCTAALMADTAPGGCGFDGGNLVERLDLADRQSVNITMRGSASAGADELLCWDDGGDRVVNVTRPDGSANPACDVPLRAGEDLPDASTSVVTAKRIVSVGGTVVSMEVRIW